MSAESGLFGTRSVRQRKARSLLKNERSDIVKTASVNSVSRILSSGRVEGQYGLGFLEVERSVAYVKPITKSILVPGTQLMGCVLEVKRSGIFFSLLAGSTGFCHWSRISSQLEAEYKESENGRCPVDLNSIFNKGDLLPVTVVHVPEEENDQVEEGVASFLKNNKVTPTSVKVSLLPTLSHMPLPLSYVYGVVESVEDHGCVIDLGMEEGKKGFLSSSSSSSYQRHQTILCQVDPSFSPSSRVVPLVPSSETSPLCPPPRSSRALAQPGLWLQCEVVGRLGTNGEKGVIVKVFTITPSSSHDNEDDTDALSSALSSDKKLTQPGLFGIIPPFHLRFPFQSSLTEGDVIVARVLFSNAFNSSLLLSLNPHVLQHPTLPSPKKPIALGSDVACQFVRRAGMRGRGDFQGWILRKVQQEDEESESEESESESESEEEEEEETNEMMEEKEEDEEDDEEESDEDDDDEDDGFKDHSKRKKGSSSSSSEMVSSNDWIDTDLDRMSSKKKEKFVKDKLVLINRRRLNSTIMADFKNMKESKKAFVIDHVRVCGWWGLEGFSIGDSREHVVSDQSVLTTKDIVMGERYRVKVQKKLTSGDAEVLFPGNKIKGLLFSHHVQDAPISSKKRKRTSEALRDGQELEVRVWGRRSNYWLVSAKPSVLASDSKVVRGIHDLGKKLVAIVSPVQTDEKYVLVELVGGWMGVLPVDTLMKQGVEEGGHKMRPGQVLQVVITGGCPSELKLKQSAVSLALDSPGYEAFFQKGVLSKTGSKYGPSSSMAHGSIVHGKIKEIQGSGALIQLSTSSMTESGSSSPLVFLPFQEVGGMDDEEKAKSILTLYMEHQDQQEQENDNEEQEDDESSFNLSFVVIQPRMKPLPIVSFDPLLLAHHPKQIQDIESLTVRECYPGTISGIEDYGLFVRLGKNMAGLVPLRYLHDDYKQATLGTYVLARLISTEVETKRIQLSTFLKHKDALPGLYLQTQLRDTFCSSILTSSLDSIDIMNLIVPGTVIQGSIEATKTWGSLLSFSFGEDDDDDDDQEEDSSFVGLCPKMFESFGQTKRKKFKKGSEHSAVIYDIDYEQGTIQTILDPVIVEAFEEGPSVDPTSLSTIKFLVLSLHDQFGVGSIVTSNDNDNDDDDDDDDATSYEHIGSLCTFTWNDFGSPYKSLPSDVTVGSVVEGRRIREEQEAWGDNMYPFSFPFDSTVKVQLKHLDLLPEHYRTKKTKEDKKAKHIRLLEEQRSLDEQRLVSVRVLNTADGGYTVLETKRIKDDDDEDDDDKEEEKEQEQEKKNTHRKPVFMSILDTLEEIPSTKKALQKQIAQKMESISVNDILHVHKGKNQFGQTIYSSNGPIEEAMENINDDDQQSVVYGVIGNLTSNLQLRAFLGFGRSVLIDMSEISDQWEEACPIPSPGSIHKVALLSSTHGSLRSSVVQQLSKKKRKKGEESDDTTSEYYNPSETDLPEAKSLVKGYVTVVNQYGVFVTIRHGIEGRIKLKNLRDEFVENVDDLVHPGMLIEGRVLSSGKRKGNKMLVEVSLRPSDVIGIGGIKKGEVREGEVRRVESFGVFVNLLEKGEKMGVVGMCHRSECGGLDVKDSLEEGDIVLVKILSIKGKKIDLTMDPSKVNEQQESQNEKKKMKQEEMEEDDDDDDEDEKEEENDDEEDNDDEEPVKKRQRVDESTEKDDASYAFSWDKKEDSMDEDDDDDDQDEEGGDLLFFEKQNEKLKEARRQQEDEFEREVLANPTSSMHWIEYMSFLVENGDIDQARSVGRRGLRAIPVWSGREDARDDERMNIWIALINLEREFGEEAGRDEENQQKEPVRMDSRHPVWLIFEESLNECDPLSMHLKMAELMEEGDESVAGDIWRRIVKRWGGVDLWGQYITYLIRRKGKREEEKQSRNGRNNRKRKQRKEDGLLRGMQDDEEDEDAAQEETVEEAVARGMQSVGEEGQLALTERIAIAEMDFGSTERGRVLFEGLVTSHPKKFDLWMVYADKEKKQIGESGKRASGPTRRIFMRAASLNWNVKKAKLLFKKFLEFELKFGSEKEVKKVRKMAKEYVESLKKKH